MIWSKIDGVKVWKRRGLMRSLKLSEPYSSFCYPTVYRPLILSLSLAPMPPSLFHSLVRIYLPLQWQISLNLWGQTNSHFLPSIVDQLSPLKPTQPFLPSIKSLMFSIVYKISCEFEKSLSWKMNNHFHTAFLSDKSKKSIHRLFLYYFFITL